MNLMQDHARVFRRNMQSAIVLYSVAFGGGIAWGVQTMYALQHTEKQFVAQVSASEKKLKEHALINIKKEDKLTMKDVKKYLTDLFSIPLSGISFSVLSLDEEGMRVRGHAPSNAVLEQWLDHVEEVFTVSAHVVQAAAEKGIVFEVLLHEKL